MHGNAIGYRAGIRRYARTSAACAALIAALPAVASAQARVGAADVMLQPVAAQPSGAHSFLIEAAGGVGGSLLGFGAIYFANDSCDVDDLGCTLESVFTGIAIGTATSAAGTWLAGRAGKTDPSLLGAALGAVVGVGAGVGLWHLFTEELDVGNRRIAAALSYSAAQGITAAAGSRLLRRISQTER